MSALGEATGGATGPPATSEPEIDRAVARLNDSAEAFAGTPAASKAKLLRDVRSRLYELAPRLADAGCTAKGINLEDEVYGEELLAGPVTTLHYVRVLEQSLLDIAEHGLPVIPSECFREHGAGSSVQVLPIGSLDRMRFASITAEAWLDAPPARASSARAGWYRDARKRASTGLVLGAGNIPAIPAMDALHELFVAGRCCLLKMSPVNEYLGPLLELALAPLIARGYLAIVYGGPQVGAYCCAHPGIAAVHITGSSETHDLIVWGDEPERSQRKARAEPLLKKTITSELGNVTPVIVPPGEYGDRELEHLARSIAGMMVHNASFNCISAKMLILPQAAAFREQLLSRLGRELEQVPTRRAYYPGAGQRYSSFVRGRNVREIGSAEGERLPWALVTGLDPDEGAMHFRKEPFCSVLSEVTLPERDPLEFLEAATRFAGEKLWGTLSAVLIAPHALLSDPSLSAACESAVERLDYGVVSVNAWSGLAFGMGELPWGAAPGSTLADVRSGIGWAHNAFMLEGVQKVVLRAPLAAFPTPFWYPRHRSLRRFARAFLDYEFDPGPLKLAKLGGAALSG